MDGGQGRKIEQASKQRLLKHVSVVLQSEFLKQPDRCGCIEEGVTAFKMLGLLGFSVVNSIPIDDSSSLS